MRFIDISGLRFGRLIVIGLSENKTKYGHLKWICQCDCGKTALTTATSLKHAGTISCGCFKSENIRRLRKAPYELNTKEYHTWMNLKDRCRNKNNDGYKNYGGRGIKVCQRWMNSYLNFIEDMGIAPSKRHSIDRINNDGDYEPSNCRWATQKEQSNNTRRTVFLDYNGSKITLSKFCQELDICSDTYRRLIKKMTIQQIINKFKQ